MEQVNERFVKLSSQIPYPSEIVMDSDITVRIGSHEFQATCVKVDTKSNQDGTVDKVYIVKFLAE